MRAHALDSFPPQSSSFFITRVFTFISFQAAEPLLCASMSCKYNISIIFTESRTPQTLKLHIYLVFNSQKRYIPFGKII